MNEPFKIVISDIFPYDKEQFIYGKIGDLEIAFLFERDNPIIKMRNAFGHNKEISFEEFLQMFYLDNDDEEEEETQWDAETE